MYTYGRGALAVKRNVPTIDRRTPRMRARAVTEQLHRIIQLIGSELSGESRAAVLTIERGMRTYVECGEAAAFCAASHHRLDEGEFEFVFNMLGLTRRGLSPSPKQQQWLRNIRDRLRKGTTP
jgi:hypothetical protein